MQSLRKMSGAEESKAEEQRAGVEHIKYFKIKKGEDTNVDYKFETAKMGAEVQNLDEAVIALLRIICLVSESEHTQTLHQTQHAFLVMFT